MKSLSTGWQLFYALMLTAFTNSFLLDLSNGNLIMAVVDMAAFLSTLNWLYGVP